MEYDTVFGSSARPRAPTGTGFARVPLGSGREGQSAPKCHGHEPKWAQKSPKGVKRAQNCSKANGSPYVTFWPVWLSNELLGSPLMFTGAQTGDENRTSLLVTARRHFASGMPLRCKISPPTPPSVAQMSGQKSTSVLEISQNAKKNNM